MGDKVLASGPLTSALAEEARSLPQAHANSKAVRVMVVHDHDTFRAGLSRLLAEQGFEIVGRAADGEQGPDIPGRLRSITITSGTSLAATPRGIETTRQLASAVPQSRVLVLTISMSDAHVKDAILAGASGYLLKDASIVEIASGIRAAAAGESVISPRIATKLLDHVRATSIEGSDDETGSQLSKREIEILRLMAEGKENKEIARDLYISPQTVKNHISNILRKLQIENRIQAAVYAVRNHIV
jgi:two-component system NarL family response regulator